MRIKEWYSWHFPELKDIVKDNYMYARVIKAIQSRAFFQDDDCVEKLKAVVLDEDEKKLHDLKISKTIAIQTAPQIRLIQNNDKALIDRVQTAIYSTIPLWKNQLVIALGLSAQQKVLRMQQAVNNTTNELLKRNAELLKQNSIETAKENERSIVDVETVREVNEKLIQTIEDTVRIQQEGRAKRQAAEKELASIEDRLRETLLRRQERPE